MDLKKRRNIHSERRSQEPMFNGLALSVGPSIHEQPKTALPPHTVPDGDCFRDRDLGRQFDEKACRAVIAAEERLPERHRSRDSLRQGTKLEVDGLAMLPLPRDPHPAGHTSLPRQPSTSSPTGSSQPHPAAPAAATMLPHRIRPPPKPEAPEPGRGGREGRGREVAGEGEGEGEGGRGRRRERGVMAPPPHRFPLLLLTTLHLAPLPFLTASEGRAEREGEGQ
ncbi:hypothetical protein SETIT_2G432100v2 [Setaria italica]|uniref:Uncharacterized protein n=1 Tax=Setaria italica TaxID=4555 RepID=A0A368Q987_SETIT|nr:hypothetical protein SETIT_2G432100v2 [Setaria italica]